MAPRIDWSPRWLLRLLLENERKSLGWDLDCQSQPPVHSCWSDLWQAVEGYLLQDVPSEATSTLMMRFRTKLGLTTNLGGQSPEIPVATRDINIRLTRSPGAYDELLQTGSSVLAWPRVAFDLPRAPCFERGLCR
jgi:hypothetical protein